MAWDPEIYGKYKEERLAPLLDLISSLPSQEFKKVLDLGCGTGVAIPYLQKIAPAAKITAMDNSPEMLQEAKGKHPEIELNLVDINVWTPNEKYDLIFSNAALHFIDDHDLFFPKLMSFLSPNGILAIQMPNNWHEPSHQIMKELAFSKTFQGQIAHLIRENPLLSKQEYRDCLGAYSNKIKCWENTYIHELKKPNPVFNWLKGTSMKPLLLALNQKDKELFSTLLKEKLSATYPSDDNGITRFPFKRLFIVAKMA